MSNIQYCPTCRGKKTILGMGMMEERCHTCFGLGQLEIKTEQKPVEPETVGDSRETSVQETEQPKRRGRKPKVDA